MIAARTLHVHETLAPAMIAIDVPGHPIAFARTRSSASGHRFTPAKQREYGNLIKLAAQNRMLESGCPMLMGPLNLTIRVVYNYPKSWSPKRCAETKWKLSKPDWDNLGKIASDAMNAIVYPDDQQIVDGRVQKQYGDREHMLITVSEVR